MGHGGWVKAAATTLNIGKWAATKKRDLTEITHSGSGGVRQRKPTVKDSSGSFELPWDDTADPSDAGFAEGADIALEMKLGASPKKLTLTSALVETVAYAVDNQTGVVMLTVAWQGNSVIVGPV